VWSTPMLSSSLFSDKKHPFSCARCPSCVVDHDAEESPGAWCATFVLLYDRTNQQHLLSEPAAAHIEFPGSSTGKKGVTGEAPGNLKWGEGNYVYEKNERQKGWGQEFCFFAQDSPLWTLFSNKLSIICHSISIAVSLSRARSYPSTLATLAPRRPHLLLQLLLFLIIVLLLLLLLLLRRCWRRLFLLLILVTPRGLRQGASKAWRGRLQHLEYLHVKKVRSGPKR